MAEQNIFLEELIKQYFDARNTLNAVKSSEHLSIYDGKVMSEIHEQNLARLINLYAKEYHIDVKEFNKRLESNKKK